MFTDTRDSSDVNPEGIAQGIYTRTVECITHKHLVGGGLTCLYNCRHTNYYCAFCLYHVVLYTKPGILCWATSGSWSLFLLVVSQQTSCWSLRAFLHSFTPGTRSSNFWQRIPLTGWQIIIIFAMSMNNLKSPTNVMITATVLIKFCTRGLVWRGERLNKFSWTV